MATKSTKALYVFSTLSCDQRYTNYVTENNDLPRPVAEVFVKGGAGVANDRVQTPRGVATRITEEDKLILETNEHFALHKKNGFVQISEEKLDPEQFAADMASRDGSAPVVPQDVPADTKVTAGDATPKSGG